MIDSEGKNLSESAERYVRDNHKKIVREQTEQFTKEKHPVSVFMAGSPGAGKTETSIELLKNTDNILRIDADELRNFFQECGYNGTNSHLFQKSATRLVHKLHDAALAKGISFLLDGTFSREDLARQNISRSLRRDRSVFVLFVYQSPWKAWHFVQKRERVEGRRIRPEDFAEKFCASREVANKMKEMFRDKIILRLICKNIDGTKRFYKKSIECIDDHILEKYSEEQILQTIQNPPD